MEVTLAPSVKARSEPLVEAVAAELATFVGRELDLTITG